MYPVMPQVVLVLIWGCQLDDLHIRTGVEVAVVAVRGDDEQYLAPHAYYTSARVAHFLELISGGSVAHFAARAEGWIIAGVDGEYFRVAPSWCYLHLLITLRLDHEAPQRPPGSEEAYRRAHFQPTAYVTPFNFLYIR